MICIQKTTADERGLIIDAVCPIMAEVENAMRKLSEIEGEFFENAEQKAISANDAERMGRIIHISTELLFDACTAFGLLTGFENWGGAKFAREQIEQISRAFRVDALADKISKKEKYMDEEKRKSIIAARCKATEMSDEQAETVLSALLKGV